LADITGSGITGNIDGISFLPTLLGKKNQKEHDYLYWEFHEQGGKIGLRMGNWKAVKLNVDKNPKGPIELYNLSEDPGETTDLSASNPDIVIKIEALIDAARTKSDVFPFKYENPE
jgi:arylsulfatase A-like enzyme